MPSPTLGYARLSTQQAPTLEIDAVTAGGCARVIARLLEQRRAGAA